MPNIDKAVPQRALPQRPGPGVANSLAAVSGARQVECTINGIGERAGNAALEEVVMALRTRSDFFDLDTGIDTTQIYTTSRLVSDLTGIRRAAEQGHRRRQRLRATSPAFTRTAC